MKTNIENSFSRGEKERKRNVSVLLRDQETLYRELAAFETELEIEANYLLENVSGPILKNETKLQRRIPIDRGVTLHALFIYLFLRPREMRDYTNNKSFNCQR